VLIPRQATALILLSSGFRPKRIELPLSKLSLLFTPFVRLVFATRYSSTQH